MPDILVHLIRNLKELLSFFVLDALMTQIVIGPQFRLISLGTKLNQPKAIITVQIQVPLLVWLPKLVTDAEHSETEVVVAGEDLYRALAWEHHLDDSVEVLGFLGFFAHLGKHCVVH